MPSQPASGAIVLGGSFFDALGIPDDDELQRLARPAGRPARAPRVEREVAGIVPRLPDVWALTSRWRLVVAGAWQAPEHIVTLEGRTNLLSLRRAASRPEGHGAVVLSIGDNLTEVMAFEKGRSGSWCLNALCRHSCAWQTATGIRWRRRRIGTLRNCADEASRFAAKGLVFPGQPLVLRGAARRQSHKAAASGARVAARALRSDRARRFPFVAGTSPASPTSMEPDPSRLRFVLVVGADADPLAGALHESARLRLRSGWKSEAFGPLCGC